MLSFLFLLIFAEHSSLGSASPTHHPIMSKRSALSNYRTENENQPHSCSPGQVLSLDGLCITPEVREHVFVYNIPNQRRPGRPPPYVPPPKVDKNIVFVNLPQSSQERETIVIPPPQQKNVIYVLNEKAHQDGRPKVIEVPAPPKVKPEVYFVNYGHGENPVLPTGEDLQSVLLEDGQEVPVRSLATGRQLSFGNNHLNHEVTSEGVPLDSLGAVTDNDHASTQISSQKSTSLHDTKGTTDVLGLTLDTFEHKPTEYKTLYYGDLKNRRFNPPVKTS